MIQHAGNEGEKIIGPNKVDGYNESGDQKVMMEFHGDYWHGNPKCYSAKTFNKVQRMTMGTSIREHWKREGTWNLWDTFTCKCGSPILIAL